jgi:HK97 gp10 family phage protein
LASFFELKGAKEFKDRLDKFPAKLQESAGRSAARKAMAIVRKAARAAAQRLDRQSTPEVIAKNVYLQQSRRGSKAIGGVMMRVGILGGARQYGNTKDNRRKGRVGASYKTLGDKGNPGGDTWYWRFLELGTENAPARPFLRPSLENNQSAVHAALAAGLDTAIDKIAKGGL